MASSPRALRQLVDKAKTFGAVPIALADAKPELVIKTSRADLPAARLASLALADLMFHGRPKLPAKPSPPEAHPHCAPQPDAACCPLPG